MSASSIASSSLIEVIASMVARRISELEHDIVSLQRERDLLAILAKDQVALTALAKSIDPVATTPSRLVADVRELLTARRGAMRVSELRQILSSRFGQQATDTAIEAALVSRPDLFAPSGRGWFKLAEAAKPVSRKRQFFEQKTGRATSHANDGHAVGGAALA